LNNIASLSFEKKISCVVDMKFNCLMENFPSMLSLAQEFICGRINFICLVVWITAAIRKLGLEDAVVCRIQVLPRVDSMNDVLR
jgi:hypothetical protein